MQGSKQSHRCCDLIFSTKTSKKRVHVFVWQIHSGKYHFLSVGIRTKLNVLFNATVFLIRYIGPF